jgi:pimeloyl-ACP methyl ester carboxylesterase
MTRDRPLEAGMLPTRQAFLTLGEGRPLLMPPGLSSHHSRPTGVSLRFELQQLKSYAATRRVWWVQRWQGLEPGTTMAAVATDYAAAPRQLVDGPVDVVGFSTGGSVACSWSPTTPTSSVGSPSSRRPAGWGPRDGSSRPGWRRW